MDPSEVTFTIPLTITVRLGGAGAVVASAEPQGAVPAGPQSGADEAAHTLAYYEGYTGYDPAFLGVAVPLPALSDEQRRNAAKNSQAAPEDDPTVLPYTHFSVVMNRRRQLAYYTVVNIDGGQIVELRRTRDRWFFDPRIAESEQIGEGLYQRNALDRGHLVRRLDPVWGQAAQRGNDDSFHFTNCSPQHERFNQGQALWQGLENFILERADARDRRVSVFTGPVLDEADPVYKGVRLPLAFWKIIAYVRPGGELATAAYVLEQAALISDIPGLEAEFDAGAFRVAIDHLVERTGLDFGYLKASELPLSADSLEAAQERVRLRADLSNALP
jgi:endonuclease G